MAKFDYESYPGDYQYEALNSRYSIQRFWHRGKLRLLDKIVNPALSDIILDLGCGSGNACFHLAKRCKKIYGVDIKKNAIRFCQDIKLKEKEKNCFFVHLTDSKLPFKDKTFDKVLLLDVIEHIDNPTNTLKEINRVLSDTGTFIITAPNYLSMWPVIEFFADRLTISPENGEQHIMKPTKKKLDKLLRASGFLPLTKAIYFVSPFFSFSGIAAELLEWEFNHNLPGMLLYSIAKKQKHI